MNPCTVILICPDYFPTQYGETFTCRHVMAETASHAVEAAQADAAAGFNEAMPQGRALCEGEWVDMTHEPDAFGWVATFAGHIDPLALSEG